MIAARPRRPTMTTTAAHRLSTLLATIVIGLLLVGCGAQQRTSSYNDGGTSGHYRAGRIFIQAGAFSVPDNAQRLRSRIAPLGSAQVMTASINGIEMYRVGLGPLPTVEQADQLLARVVDGG